MYFHRTTTILEFLTRERMQKCLTCFQSILARLKIRYLQAESHINNGFSYILFLFVLYFHDFRAEEPLSNFYGFMIMFHELMKLQSFG